MESVAGIAIHSFDQPDKDYVIGNETRFFFSYHLVYEYNNDEAGLHIMRRNETSP